MPAQRVSPLSSGTATSNHSPRNDRRSTDPHSARPPAERHYQVVLRQIASLKPDPSNPRQHSHKQIKQIARSIETFGFNVPVLVDPNLRIVAGHGRVLACQLLGWSQVPTISLDHLSDAQARAFMIADNRLTENSTWDDRLLGEQFKALAELNLDFQLEDTGFEMGEIDLCIQGLSEIEDSDPADELPTDSGSAICRPGDLWQLGPHRIVCGSALDASAYDRLMDKRQAAMVFTDPPYNVPIDGHATGLGAVRHTDFAMACGEMSEAEFTQFLIDTCRLLAQHSVDGALLYICMDWRHAAELLAAGKAVFTEYKNLCVWSKSNAGMGSLYRSQHELIFVFKQGSASHRNNVQLGQFGRYRTNVWQYPSANSFSRKGGEGNLLALHPTVKPVRMVADALLDCTARGDLVLDAFLGSGTTLIAAERVGRMAYGLEIEPRYVDTTIQRWQRLTGQAAIHAETGRSFDETVPSAEFVPAEESCHGR